MKKNITRIMLSVAVALLIELLVFHFSAIRGQIAGLTEIVFQQNDFDFINWLDTANDEKVSELDPMLCMEGVQTYIERMTIRLDAEPMPGDYAIFYTEDAEENFSGDKMIALSPVTGKDTISVGKDVYSLRIDPGDNAGLALRSVSVTLNEQDWTFSAARILAMLVVYWGTSLLMRLQQSPDYGLDLEQLTGEEPDG